MRSKDSYAHGEIETLRAELDRLREQVRAIEAREQPIAPRHNVHARVSRGGLLRAAGAAAAGAAAASVMGSGAAPVEAANGGSVALGQDNSATAVTSLSGAVLGDAALRVTNFYANSTTNPPSPGQIDDYSDAFQAYTFGSGLTAVYGRNDAAGGSGVFGYSGSGLGGSFYGGLAPIRLQPGSAAGAPTAGGHQQGEIYVDNTGAFFVCYQGDGTTAGSWKRINSTIPIAPIRVLDTRNGTGGYSGLQNGATLTLTLSNGTMGANGSTTPVPIPNQAVGLIGNIRAYTPQAAGVITVYPGNGAAPTASSLNYINADAAEQPYAICNEVTVGLQNQMISIYVSATTQVVFDLTGYIL